MKEVDPKWTPRTTAFEMWMNAPMPMVTLFKTLNVTRLLSFSRREKLKFNMLMCYCIGRAAAQIEEFYLLPVGGKLMKYDKIAVNTVVNTKDGNISTCDIPFSEELQSFNSDYLTLTKQVGEACQPHEVGDDYMVIGTSALVGCDIDGAVNIYAGVFNNPFVIWGKYRKKLFKTVLPISFQFHHTQMDGGHAAKFLECLQNEINNIKFY